MKTPCDFDILFCKKFPLFFDQFNVKKKWKIEMRSVEPLRINNNNRVQNLRREIELFIFFILGSWENG